MNAISYWRTYIQAVLMVLMFVRATRESDWKAHVETFRLMLPFFFSLDRQNYARLVLAKILYAKFAINITVMHGCHSVHKRIRHQKSVAIHCYCEIGPTPEFFNLSLKVV